MTTATRTKTTIEGETLQPFVQVLLGASGITEEQAKICLLYALCTYRTDLEKIPLLTVMGMTGTGKSALLNQMTYIVNDPTVATGNTYATTRNEIDKCTTYIVDEADRISERLLLLRTDKNLSSLTYNVGTGHGWEGKPIDIFGATILARRNPFRDSAVRNRAIVIRTQNNPAEYKVEVIQGLDKIAKEMKIESMVFGSGRVRDTWTPLLEVARAIDDPSYEEAVENAVKSEQTIFRSGQEYEASEVVLYALDKLTWDINDGKRLENDIELSELTDTANDIGDVQLIKRQVEELLISMGFKVTFTHGTKFVRSDVELLESLL